MALPLGGGAMAAAQQNQDLYALPFQIPPRPIQYFLRTARQGVALPATNMEALFAFRVPTQGSFGVTAGHHCQSGLAIPASTLEAGKFPEDVLCLPP